MRAVAGRTQPHGTHQPHLRPVCPDRYAVETETHKRIAARIPSDHRRTYSLHVLGRVFGYFTIRRGRTMKLKEFVWGATISGALGAAALAVGVGWANAAPPPPPPAPGAPHGPEEPGYPGGPGNPGGYGGPGEHGPGGPGEFGQPGGPGGPGRPGEPGGYGAPGGSGPWHGDGQRGYFQGAPWGDGPAPWGPGEPPPPAWNRPLPPPGGQWNEGPINYFGYEQTPVWNPGFNQWGINFFGVWIPL